MVGGDDAAVVDNVVEERVCGLKKGCTVCVFGCKIAKERAQTYTHMHAFAHAQERMHAHTLSKRSGGRCDGAGGLGRVGITPFFIPYPDTTPWPK